MGEKFLLALLSVMLVILLVFNSFGIAYNNNNFFGTILTVEEKLGETSENLLTSYDRLKEFFLSVGDFSTSLYDATFGKFIAWIEESTGYSLFGIVLEGLKDITNTMREGSTLWGFFQRYGISFNSTYLDKFKTFCKCVKSDQFWEEYDTRTGFDWEKVEKYISAVYDGELNEYAYEIFKVRDKIAAFWLERFEQGEKMFIGGSYEKLSENIGLRATDFRYYFTTVDLSPSGLVDLVPDNDQFYYQYITDENIDFPVYDTNIYIEDDNGVKYYLKRFKFSTATSTISRIPVISDISFLSGTYSCPLVWLFSNNPEVLLGFDVIDEDGQLVPVWYSSYYVLEQMLRKEMSWWESTWFDLTHLSKSWALYPLTEW